MFRELLKGKDVYNRSHSPKTSDLERKRSRRSLISFSAASGYRCDKPVNAIQDDTSTALPQQLPPTIDYVSRMRRAQEDSACCPLLMLAPMESLGDWRFRRALADTVGGFDEACTEFLRIPNRADHPRPAVRGVVSQYNACELGTLPIGAQIMSSNPELLGLATGMLFQWHQAPRVDLNCGCPANTVTGNGAGSSLLRTPELLHDCVKAMVAGAAGAGPVSVKMRSGYEDTSRFEENLLAAQEAGAAFITVHPRTKNQTYDGRADWSLVARARQLLSIPVVGNGDVVSAEAARQLLTETRCGAVMIGRGAVSDPLLFLRVRAAYQQDQVEGPPLPWEWDEPEIVQSFLRRYAATCLKQVDLGGGQQTGGHLHQGGGVMTGVGHDNGCSTSSLPGSNFQSHITSSSVADNILKAHHANTGQPIDSHLAMSRSAFFGRMKKIMRYLFSGEPELWQASEVILRAQPGLMTADELVDLLCGHIQRHWAPEGQGPTQRVLYNHMTKSKQLLEK